MHNNGGLYTIIDTAADSIIGVITIHRHVASAIRMFTDIASDQSTSIFKHPTDYQLVRLGYLNPENHVVSEFEIILTGADWLANLPPEIRDRITGTSSAPTLKLEQD